MGLNIGCELCKIPGMHNVDIRFEVHPDIVMDMKHLGYPDQSINEINLGNVVEHLSRDDILTGLQECRRVLMPQGVLYITSPLIDVAQQCYNQKEIDEATYRNVVHGEGDGYNSHKTELRAGDLEQLLFESGFRSEPLDLSTFPYLVVANVNNPKPDPWICGIKATKYGDF